MARKKGQGSSPMGAELAEFRKKTLRVTQKVLGEQLLGLSPHVWKNYEYDKSEPSEETMQKLRDLGFRQSISGLGPRLPDGRYPVPYIGAMRNNMRVDWKDLGDIKERETVPADWFRLEATLAGTLEDDSLMPFCHPKDLLVFHVPDVVEAMIPTMDKLAVHRSLNGRLTIGTVGHDGHDYTISPLNPRYETVPLDGEIVAYLVGWKRVDGEAYTTSFNPRGFRPQRIAEKKRE